jgi:hypothetical protein
MYTKLFHKEVICPLIRDFWNIKGKIHLVQIQLQTNEVINTSTVK